MKRCHWIVLALAVLCVRAAAEEGSPKPDQTTIAVLDFVNRSPSEGRDWLGKGLADMVIADLSASGRLAVVDRERMQEVARELELIEAGGFDEKKAPRAGQIAKAKWVIFGSFACKGDRVALEAIVIDAARQQTLRIEQVEGPLAKVFGLEQALVGKCLAKLNVPMTEQEVRQATLLRTESLPALEHYSRSLGLFDGGEWHDALTEARLARKADPNYLAARIRVAQLYHEVGEAAHAVIEYRRIADSDPEDKLSEAFYFRMARVLGDALGDHEGGARVLERILRRQKVPLKPFRITDPPGNSHRWESAKYAPEASHAPAESPLFMHLKALACLAAWQAEARDPFESAKAYSLLMQFASTEEAPLGPESVAKPFLREMTEKYTPLYWRFVRENRDATLYPARTLHLLPEKGGRVGTEAPPTHFAGGADQVWLAPPGLEIAKVRFAVEASDRIKERPSFQPMPGSLLYPGSTSFRADGMKADAEGIWYTKDIAPGVRAVETRISRPSRPPIEFFLRPWSPDSLAKPEPGSISVTVSPGRAIVFVDGELRGRTAIPSAVFIPGKGLVRNPDNPPSRTLPWLAVPAGTHKVEVRWPDGRSRSDEVKVEPGQEARAFLGADGTLLSHRTLAPRGSYPCLLTDHAGRLWLVWDDTAWGDMGRNPDPDLFAAVAADGVHWSSPRRLPMSSLAYDAHPVLQQDGRGRFWLAWESDRDPKAPRSLWIASSPNAIEWSFPRKIAVPRTEGGDLERWRANRDAQFAFAVDHRETFWLIRQGWLFRSQDTRRWEADGVLHTNSAAPDEPDHGQAKHYHLSCDREGQLLLFANPWGGKSDDLWRRSTQGDWTCLGPLNRMSGYIGKRLGSGSFAPQRDGSLLFAALSPDGLSVHEQGGALAQPRTFWVEGAWAMPYHPSVAALPGGRFAVAYGSKDGLTVATFQKAQTQAKDKGTE